jgi:hypothetical protein
MDHPRAFSVGASGCGSADVPVLKAGTRIAGATDATLTIAKRQWHRRRLLPGCE